MTSTFGHRPATVRLGDLEVCRLGYGAMQLPGPHVWGEPVDPQRARLVLKRAVDLGVQLIDTAWFYGPLVANRLIAEALHPYPTDLVIATKLGGRRTPDKGWVPGLRPDELQAGCEEDLRSLRKERLDVVHLRWMGNAGIPFREALDAMLDLKSQGKIRHLALSNVTLAQLQESLQRGPIVDVQNLYNVAAGERRLGTLAAAVTTEQEELVDFCARNDIAFMPFFSLSIPGPNNPTSPAVKAIAKRRGATEAQVAIAWLLARSPTLVPIPGTSSPEHLAENWSARTLVLTPEELAEISRARSEGTPS